MINVLLTGSTGFVGSTLLTRILSLDDLSLSVALRKLTCDLPCRSYLIDGLNKDTDWSSALVDQQVVIHAAARAHIKKDASCDSLVEYRKVNVEGTENLAMQAAVAGVKRFIFISSIGVNGINSVHPFTEQDNECPHDPYSQSKFEAEIRLKKIALETGMDVVIIRPPLVYGGNAPGNFGSLIKLLAKPLPLPFGAVHNKRSMVYVGNLVDFIFYCIDQPKAANQIFLISDREDLSLTSLIQKIRKAMNKPFWLLPIPVLLFNLVGKLTGKMSMVDRLVGDLQVDSSKAMSLLDWKPPYTVDQGIQATVDSFLENNKKVIK